MSNTYKDLRTEYNTPSFKQELFNIHGTRCINCGSDLDVELHHIVPLGLGGTNRITNIVPLCHLCHQKAHGSVNIRKICRAENTGRPKKKPVNGYKDILYDYLHGEFGRKECEQKLQLGRATKLTDRWFFREYLAENNIVKYKNKIDLFNCSNRSKADRTNQVIAVIEYGNGNVYKRYGNGREEYTIQG